MINVITYAYIIYTPLICIDIDNIYTHIQTL